MKLAWITLILGIWLVVAPFILGYSDNTTVLWNEIIVGALVIIFSLAGTTVKKSA